METLGSLRLPDGDELFDQLLDLRAHDLHFDTNQLATAAAMLLQAHAAAEDAPERRRFWTRLIPVLATSAETASLLSARFAEAFADQKKRPAAAYVPSEVDVLRTASAEPARGQWAALIRTIGALCVISVALALLLVGITSRSPVIPRMLPPATTPSPSAAPVNHLVTVPRQTFETREASIERQKADTFRTRLGMILVALAMLALLAAGLWAQARRRKSELDPFARIHRFGQERAVNVDTAPLEAQFSGRAFQKVVQRLNASMSTRTRDLDVARTIRATVQAGDVFTRVDRVRRRQPEFLVLVERQSANDHLAALHQLAVEAMRSEGMDVRLYFYSNDPRELIDDRRTEPKEIRNSLESLRSLAPAQRLLIFGAADSFLMPQTHTPWPWVSMFACWSERAVLDPRARQFWREGEIRLVEAGWSLGVARVRSLDQFADHILSGRGNGKLLERQSKPRPQ